MPKKPRIFVCLDDQEIANRIARARDRVVYAAPSISIEIAEAIGARTDAVPQLKVDVILDVDPQSLRLGYGEIGALKYLMRHSIDIRCCPGLKIGVLAVDRRSFVFAPTAKIIEDIALDSPNAINIVPTMTEWLLHAMVPKDMIVEIARGEVGSDNISDEPDHSQPAEPPHTKAEFDEELSETGIEPDSNSETSNAEWIEPEIGIRLFQPEEMEQLADDIEQRPPKAFDHEREILVYNGYLRFVDIRFTGGRLSARTVQLPEEILNLAQDQPELFEVKATCRIFEGADLLPEVRDFERSVDEIRRCHTKSLGNDLGRVVLVAELAAFDKEVGYLVKELDEIRKRSIKEITKALRLRKKRLKKILFAILFENPNPELKQWINGSGLTKEETVGRYLAYVMDPIFPNPSSLIERMELVCTYKDVTWEMLNDAKFGEAIRRFFPNEQFTKLYKERNTIGERGPRPTGQSSAVDDEWPSEII